MNSRSNITHWSNLSPNNTLITSLDGSSIESSEDTSDSFTFLSPPSKIWKSGIFKTESSNSHKKDEPKITSSFEGISQNKPRYYGPTIQTWPKEHDTNTHHPFEAQYQPKINPQSLIPFRQRKKFSSQLTQIWAL